MIENGTAWKGNTERKRNPQNTKWDDRKLWITSSWADTDLHARAPHPRWRDVQVVLWLGQEGNTFQVGENYMSSDDTWVGSRETWRGKEMLSLRYEGFCAVQHSTYLVQNIRRLPGTADNMSSNSSQMGFSGIEFGLWVWSRHCAWAVGVQKGTICSWSSSSSQKDSCEKMHKTPTTPTPLPTSPHQPGWVPVEDYIPYTKLHLCAFLSDSDDWGR